MHFVFIFLFIYKIGNDADNYIDGINNLCSILKLIFPQGLRYNLCSIFKLIWVTELGIELDFISLKMRAKYDIQNTVDLAHLHGNVFCEVKQIHYNTLSMENRLFRGYICPISYCSASICPISVQCSTVQHPTSLSPVCFLSCRFRTPNWLKPFPHWEQW